LIHEAMTVMAELGFFAGLLYYLALLAQQKVLWVAATASLDETWPFLGI
jgi:hypothetical protein